MSTPPNDPLGAAIHAQAEAMTLVLSHEGTIERLRAENADLKASLAAMAGLTGEQTEQLRAENEELQAKVDFMVEHAQAMADNWRDAITVAIENKAELDKHKTVVRFWRDIFGRSR